MDLTGDPSGPPTKVGTCIADLVTGLYAAQAILLALRARERLGRGQKVEVAMIDAMASLLTYNAGMYFASGREPTRYGNAHPMIVPYGSFKTSDGWVNIAVANDNLWKKFCDACGFDRTVCDDPRFASARARVENRDILLPFVTDIIEQNTKIHWIRLFERAGVPCGEIRTTGEVCEDPALIARGMIRSIAHSKIGRLRTIDTPVRLYDTPAAPGVGAPVLGQHTASILQEILGLTPLEVQLLRESHVIMCARAESAH
jgi:formyl-CoA transferase